MKLIEIEDLVVKLGGHTALEKVDFSLDAGEIVTIVGPQRIGENDAFAALSSARFAPTAGRVHRRDGLRIGYVPQRLNIDPSLPIQRQALP